LFNIVAVHPKFVNDPVNAIADHVKYLTREEQ